MKKTLSVILIVCILLAITSCAKLINTKYENVEVEITDIYYKNSYMVPMRVGKITTVRTQPAVYRTIVEHNGVEYSINGKETYDKYRDKVGEKTFATLEICIYDDGTVKKNIIKLN